MKGMNCDEEGGWTRVAYLNMTEPGTTCPSGLTQTGYNNLDHHVCGRFNPWLGGCNSTFFAIYSLNYIKICGHSPNAFSTSTSNIDSYYVDSVSITYGSSPRQHIWTYLGGWAETRLDGWGCPCNSGSSVPTPPPSFVGNDCEFFMLMIHYGMDRIVMDLSLLVLILTCHGFLRHWMTLLLIILSWECVVIKGYLMKTHLWI